MRIMLTNDDGINADGINILYDVLSSRHDVYIIAPDSEKSACSNGISVHYELILKEITEKKFSVSGLPADCVDIGLHGNIIPETDIVISGINHGPNLGDDIFFSGTVAGARTACIFGKPGIAVSMDRYRESSVYLADAAEFILGFLSENAPDFARDAYFYNINYPDLPGDEIKGVKYTFIGKRIYMDSYRKTAISKTEMKLNLEGSIISPEIHGSDVTELRNGFISITPLALDCTNLDALKKHMMNMI
ncbi:MAG: 5'/3'-nucleotidase SurE [Spirochaetes bacterium]|jgi:5'-nucleotidase|nr:5'/3'-nucleotidase SurE [Spirochaetota bacterium]